MSDGIPGYDAWKLASPPESETPPRDCELCGVVDGHDADCHDNPEYDPTPWCSGCGARKRSQCDCGPLAEND